MAPRKVIIDTDPGVDDVLAILLALASPEELDVLMLSVTYGNVEVTKCLANVISVFHHIGKEWEWRRANGRTEGFESLKRRKPIVAVGAEAPLGDGIRMADYFHGLDGLGGIDVTHPQMTPEETWKVLFDETLDDEEHRRTLMSESLFEPSKLPAHREILRLLRENEPDTITIVVIGPMTNVSMAATEDTATFLRAREVVVMGGVVEGHGNVTPVAEFNTFADTIAAARVLALTSALPSSTMPPIPLTTSSEIPVQKFLQPYAESVTKSKQLKVTLFPLDVTSKHSLNRGKFNDIVQSSVGAGSPLAAWLDAFLTSTFAKVESLSHVAGDSVQLDLHDPLTVWYLIDYATRPSSWTFAAPDDQLEDMRVETAGQWTQGMMVVDRRSRRKRDVPDGEEGQMTGDEGGWLINGRGNRVKRCTGSGSEATFGETMLRRILDV